jgi:glycosyltransferase involved in cell wall biosynthesis
VDHVHSTLRVGVVADFLEEGWPSMDLVAELTVAALSSPGAAYAPELLRPRMPRPASRLVGGRGRNVDRFVGRHLVYPRWLRRRAAHDLFHVVDHSYAQLVHALPVARTVVTCHDLDTFRALLDPAREPRPRWFRAMASRVLAGLGRAAWVVTDSDAVRDALLEHDLVPAERVTTVPLPAHPDFTATPDAAADAEAARLLGEAGSCDLLHVGSTAERKRIPLLLRAFAALAARHPGARLLRVGGPLEREQRVLAARLGVEGRLVELPFLARPVLAAVYRRAALVVNPSEREGFGLPLVEAMACGAPVLASDLAVFREVGGDGVRYVAEGRWEGALVEEVDRLAEPGARHAARERACRRADRYTLAAYGAGLAEVYDRVAQR